MNEDIKTAILNLIEDICGDDIVKEDPDIDLFEEGLFDSLTAIELLVSLEDEYGVAIAPTEIEREEMGTPNRIIATVAARMASPAMEEGEGSK